MLHTGCNKEKQYINVWNYWGSTVVSFIIKEYKITQPSCFLGTLCTGSTNGLGSICPFLEWSAFPERYLLMFKVFLDSKEGYVELSCLRTEARRREALTQDSVIRIRPSDPYYAANLAFLIMA